MRCRILSILLDTVLTLMTGIVLLEAYQQTSNTEIPYTPKKIYLVPRGIRMPFRVQVLGFFPASASMPPKLGFICDVELA
jgi:hypothetical protein